MPQRCRICFSPDRSLIETAHESRRSLRDIARAFNVSKDSIARHLQAHGRANRDSAELRPMTEPRQEQAGAEAEYQDFLCRWKEENVVSATDLRSFFNIESRPIERLVELLAEALRRGDLFEIVAGYYLPTEALIARFNTSTATAETSH